MLRIVFIGSSYDSFAYIRSKGIVKSYLLLYVDHIFRASSSKKEINEIKAVLGFEYDMNELGSAKRKLGMDIVRNKMSKDLLLSQRSYLKKVLHRFNV